jgi:putative flippase GtrA
MSKNITIALFNMKRNRLSISPNTQIQRFLFVGVIAVCIDAISYALLVDQINIEHGLSKRISFILGSLWAFGGNKYFTFHSTVPPGKEFVLFSLLYLSSFLANGWIHDVTYKLCSSGLVSFLTATSISTIINFVGQKFIVFRSSND